MPFFVKRPIKVEARRMVAGVYFGDWDGVLMLNNADCSAIIKTLEGDMCVDYGDWVIKGVSGEVYPCKHDIFMQTYKEV